MKALIVDDSMVARAVIKKVITSIYPDVVLTEAKNAADAIQKLEETDFDIFTVDFNMPGDTGDVVIHRAKERCPTAKICLLTANKQSAMQEKCQEWGVTLVAKPHFQDALAEFIRA